MSEINQERAVSQVFGGFGGGGRIAVVAQPVTELQELLIGENPRRNYKEYHAENRKRRSADLPIGDFPRLVSIDESEWAKDMAFLGTETIEQGMAEMPMSRTMFEDVQAVANEYNMSTLVPHRWIAGEWWLSAPYSLVPRFRIPMGNIISWPGQMQDMAADFQLALLSIGEEVKGKVHPGHGDGVDFKAKLAQGQKRRKEGVICVRGVVENQQLRKGMVGYPVILPGVDYSGGSE